MAILIGDCSGGVDSEEPFWRMKGFTCCV